jgi:hypothetical protein
VDVSTELEESSIGLVKKESTAFTKFALEYEHNGKKWCDDFFADDEDDARAKVESMKKSLALLGEITDTIYWKPSRV